MPLPEGRAEACATFRAMAESGQVICPTIAPFRNVCWLQQHVARVSPEGCQLHKELQRPEGREHFVKACFRCRIVSA